MTARPLALLFVFLFIMVPAQAALDAGEPTSPGSLLGWGKSDKGQLNTIAASVLAPRAIADGFTFSQIAPGKEHVLALDETGHLFVWGHDGLAALGNGAGRQDALTPQPLMADKTFKDISAGLDISAAIASDGTLYGWGFGKAQLEAGPQDPPLVEAPKVLRPGQSFDRVAVASNAMFAIAPDGSLHAWGLTLNGILGMGRTDAEAGSGIVMPGTSFRYVSAGGDTAMALTTDGRLFGWGSDLFGVVGNGPEGAPGSACPSDENGCWVPQHIMPGTTWQTVATASSSHVLAIDSTGQGYSWGSDQFGQLGHDDPGRTTRDSTPAAFLPGVPLESVAVGRQQSLALGTDGTLYAWGSDGHGQVGDGPISEALNIRQEPVIIPAPGPVRAIAAFHDSSYALVGPAVDQPPVAAIQAPRTADITSAQVSFEDASTDDLGIVSWAWDFGNGQTSTEEDPSATFEPGFYIVRLKVTDAKGQSDATLHILEVPSAIGQRAQSYVVEGQVPGGGMGIAVAVDDNRMGVGASAARQVQLHEEIDGVWQQTATIPALDGTNFFGIKVALEGDILAITGGLSVPGEPPDSQVTRHRVFMYQWDGAEWQHTQTFAPEDEALAGTGFGIALRIDGGRLILGEPYYDGPDDQLGRVQIYEQDGGMWMKTFELVGAVSLDVADAVGGSVSISGDRFATTPSGFFALVVFALADLFDPDDKDSLSLIELLSQDHLNLHQFVKGDWLPMEGPSFQEGEAAAFSVALDGDRLAVTGFRETGQVLEGGIPEIASFVSIFEHDGTTWQLQQRIDAPAEFEENPISFGVSLFLNGDRLLVREMHLEDGDSTLVSSTFVYDFDGTEWKQTTRTAHSSTGLVGDLGGLGDLLVLLGDLVSPSDSDGHVMAVGDPFFDMTRGRAFLYDSFEQDNPPLASFEVPEVRLFKPDRPIAMRDTSRDDGQIASWLWDFGDGTTSSEQHPEHAFKPGAHAIHLTVTDDSGQRDTAASVVHVEEGIWVDGRELHFFPGSSAFDADGGNLLLGTGGVVNLPVGGEAEPIQQDPTASPDFLEVARGLMPGLIPDDLSAVPSLAGSPAGGSEVQADFMTFSTPVATLAIADPHNGYARQSLEVPGLPFQTRDVALAGARAAVGYDDAGFGRVAIFEDTGMGWELQTLLPDVGAPPVGIESADMIGSPGFGSNVAFDGNQLAVADPFLGVIFIYEPVAMGWDLVATLYLPEQETLNGFLQIGSRLAFDDGILATASLRVVDGPGDQQSDAIGFEVGLFVFTKVEGTWGLRDFAIFAAGPPEIGDLAVHDGRILVGHGVGPVGADLYAFDGTLQHLHGFDTPDGAIGFGSSVALQGDTALIGRSTLEGGLRNEVTREGDKDPVATPMLFRYDETDAGWTGGPLDDGEIETIRGVDIDGDELFSATPDGVLRFGQVFDRPPTARLFREGPWVVATDTPVLMEGVARESRESKGILINKGSTTISWDLGPAGMATGPEVSPVFETVGDYLIRMTATDASGQSDTVERTLYVREAELIMPGDGPPFSNLPPVALPLVAQFVTGDPIELELPVLEADNDERSFTLGPDAPDGLSVFNGYLLGDGLPAGVYVFTYEVSDGHASDEATVRLTVHPKIGGSDLAGEKTHDADRFHIKHGAGDLGNLAVRQIAPNQLTDAELGNPPTGTRFSEVVQIDLHDSNNIQIRGGVSAVVTYNEAALRAAGIPDSAVTLFYWNGAEWLDVRSNSYPHALPGAPDGQDNIVHHFEHFPARDELFIVLDHFSTYAVGGSPPPASGGGGGFVTPTQTAGPVPVIVTETQTEIVTVVEQADPEGVSEGEGAPVPWYLALVAIALVAMRRRLR